MKSKLVDLWARIGRKHDGGEEGASKLASLEHTDIYQLAYACTRTIETGEDPLRSSII